MHDAAAGGAVTAEARRSKEHAMGRLLRSLGPGVTTGAADDDPSGIATYSVVGAQHGLAFLWSALFIWPLMGCVQMMCARIGMVTGMGLAGAMRQKYPRWLVGLAVLLLLLANIINIAADLGGMADAAHMLRLGPSMPLVWLFGLGISALTVWLRYHQIANILKWLALALFAYVITAFLVHPDWSSVLRATLIPSIPRGSEGWGALVAILGTTISPYLFFWQAGQEVEEDKAKGHHLLTSRLGASRRQLADRRIDVGVGTFFSNLAMFFIILTTAATLHRHGVTQIATSRDAAEALRPLAGRYAYFLYTVGIVGTGLLAIPTLAGSAAYAVAETFDWRYGLDEKFKNAAPFYAVFVLATVAGVMLDFLRINPIQALYWTAIINGFLAPFLLLALLLVANDRRIMQGQSSSRLSRSVVALTTLLMFAAAIAMLAL
ncbi:MAG TPA: divalent metal cation transporter [Steroidobacteraceae bacterium]|jgi:NRAMP (natural resistance-associated macrophage protein)-like metal ion transporter|nr:divalent metal cation transporter [Steroidobacteraceae bacterium]